MMTLIVIGPNAADWVREQHIDGIVGIEDLAPMHVNCCRIEISESSLDLLHHVCNAGGYVVEDDDYLEYGTPDFSELDA